MQSYTRNIVADILQTVLIVALKTLILVDYSFK